MDSATAEYQTMVSQYASVGALAVLTWDILDNIPGDYHILFAKQQRKWTLATVVYICARIGAFTYGLLSVIFDTAPIGHCALLNNVALAWCAVSFGGTALLFFLRLRAVYSGNRLVVFIFFILWLAVLVGGALAPLGSKGAPLIGPDGIATGYCEEVSINAISSYGLLAPLGFDTLVLLAISWRLSNIPTMNESGKSMGKNVHTMLFGTNLPYFAKTLLVDGQIYYLITVILGVACTIMLFSPFVPLPLSDTLEDVYPAMINIMACRLFRRTKSGTIRESELSPSMTIQRARSAPMRFALSSGSTTEVESKDTVLTV